MKYTLIQLCCCLLSIAYAQQNTPSVAQELPANVNKTLCIPLKNLRDAMVQRGLGEARKIRKVQLYLTGSGNVDVSVAIALRFLDESYTKPIVHKCGEYRGSADNVVVTVDCADEEDGPNSDGFTGYAVYAQFHGDVANQAASICQMDIILHDKYEQQKDKKPLIIFIGIVFGLFIVALIGVAAWYFWDRQKMRREEELAEGVQYWEENNVIDDSGNKKQQSTILLNDDEDDEVFLR